MAGCTKNPVEATCTNINKEETRGFTTTTSTYASDMYPFVVEKDIHDFLDKTGVFDARRGRWRVPEPPSSTEEVVAAVSRVFSAIVERFAQARTPGVERNVVEIHDTNQEDRSGPLKAPNLIVLAAGPSFQVPSAENSILSSQSLGNVGYSNIASCSAVRCDTNIGTAKENVEEMEVYARHIFRVQPNRIFVRSLVLTEKHARLVHFDRSGARVTPLIDIHQRPGDLVRLIVGLSATNERLLGLDDSVQWSIVGGRKAEGNVTMSGPSGEVKTYPIVRQLRVPQHSIRSRGTTCWVVRDPDTGEYLVVKDSWREDDLVAEHQLLERVRDIPGVVHMVSCEPEQGETKDFRCVGTVGQFKNRKASRVLLKRYGKTVEYFSSTVQVLCAFRDAILGHQQLVERGILHRDISLNNILLGRPCAPEGERGILIDLDLAFLATEEKPKVKSDYTIGTHLFQSISVLWSRQLRERAWEHDYLEDLEAFFYSLAFIFLCYLPDGSLVPAEEDGPAIPWAWADETPAAAHRLKLAFFGVGTIAFDSSRIVRKNWGPICHTMFSGLRRFLFQMRGKKNSLIARAAGAVNPLEPFHSCRSEHYATVVKMFDDAIQGLQPSTPALPLSGSPKDRSVEPSKPEASLASATTPTPSPHPPSINPPPPPGTVVQNVEEGPHQDLHVPFIHDAQMPQPAGHFGSPILSQCQSPVQTQKRRREGADGEGIEGLIPEAKLLKRGPDCPP